MEKTILQYNPFTSFIDPGFWHKFTQIKLDVDKLSSGKKRVCGSYCFHDDIGNLLEVNSTAFNNNPDVQKYESISYGILLNKNTIEDFRDCDKSELLNEEGKSLWEDMKSDRCVDNPQLLSRFFILSFADLKKYQYYYWFAFPTPTHPIVYLNSTPVLLNQVYTKDQLLSFYETYGMLHNDQKQFFAIRIEGKKLEAIPMSQILHKLDPENVDRYLFGFLDPSNDQNPGWALRNYICLIAFKNNFLQGRNLKIVSLRLYRNDDFSKSLLYDVALPEDLNGPWGEKWIGWERNDKGKFLPRISNMAASMDPTILAETSVDLNLKLMKWRLLPNLDLDIIKTTKCLLLGAGTLGCAVARNLLAWGVRDITLVDNGKVSFSNPVRQSLFTHEDCLNGGKQKATAAADNLKKIFPGANSRGVTIHIPMPGHTVGDSLKDDVTQNIKTLTELISTNDVVFFLLDSREARWLPTLLCSHFNKLVINAALGFDSYLIMRHGISENADDSGSGDGQTSDIKRKLIPGHQLGCYFCNDVTSPGNSQKDRTLDQQCTVTRPGVSNIAGALACEIAIAVLQHPKKTNASAPHNFEGEISDDESLLGPIPHSIRGFLTNFQHVLPSNGKFRQCIACSEIILDHYRTEENKFLFEVFNNAKYLEDITGLTKLHDEATNAEIWEIDEVDDEESD